MEFDWSPEDDERYARIVRTCRESLGQDVAEREPAAVFSPRDWARCGELGLLGLSLPEAHGGSGLGALAAARSMEAFGYACPDMGLVFSAAAHQFGCAMVISEFAREPVQEWCLRDLASGHKIGASAASEPGAGSDLAAMTTRADRRDDAYSLTGDKCYVTNGPIADVIVVYASSDPHAGSLGLSAFVVDARDAGVQRGLVTDKGGLRTSPMGSITLRGCTVPATHRLGGEGEGLAVFMRSMAWERCCLLAAYLGMLDRQIERCVEFANHREQFGQPIAKYQAVAHRIVDMKVRLESARLLLYRACWRCEQGRESLEDIAMAKLATAEAAVASSLDAVRVFGTRGVLTEAGIEQMLRDAIPATILGGTSDIQRNLVAIGLGLRI